MSRKAAWLTGICAAAALTGLLLWMWMSPRYFLSKARGYLEDGETRSAAMSVQHVLANRPDHREALALKAAILERVNKRESAQAWARLAALSGEKEHYFKAINMALHSGETNVLAEAREVIHRRFPDSAESKRLLSLEALGRQDWDEARRLLQETEGASNPIPYDRFMEGALGLFDESPDNDAESIRALEGFQETPFSYRLSAYRILTGHFFKAGQYQKAMQYARTLMAWPECAWEDRFNYLELLRLENPDAIPSFVGECLDLKPPKPVKINLCRRLLDAGLTEPASRVLEAIEGGALENPDMTLLHIVLNGERGKWREVLDLKDAGVKVRHPVLDVWAAIAAARLGLDSQSAAFLKVARMKVGRNPALLGDFARLSDRMDWTEGAIAFYTDYSVAAKDGHLALDALERHLKRTDNAAAYADLQKLRLERQPDSFVVQNNYAYIHLLLNLENAGAHDAAAAAFEKAGRLESIASTYAFSLIRQKGFQNALNVLNGIEKPRDPTTLLMKALCHRGLEDMDSLGSLLDRIDESNFWNEERRLLEELKSARQKHIQNS